MLSLNGITVTPGHLLAKDRQTTGQAIPESLTIKREEEAGFHLSPCDSRPVEPSESQSLYSAREDDAGFRLSPGGNSAAGQSSPELISVNCEEEAGFHLSPNQETTKSVTKAEYDELRRIGFMYGLIFEGQTESDTLPDATCSSDDVMSSQGNQFTDWNPTIDESYSNNWWTWQNVFQTISNSSLSPTSIQDQLSGLASPSSELAEETEGLNQFISTPERSTTPVSLNGSITELSAESGGEQLEQPDLSEPKSTNTLAEKSIKRRSRCNRTKNISLLKGNANSEWQCLPCNRMFRNRGGLLQHNNTHHSGEKPFVCKFCGKRYHAEDAMLQHERRHTFADKPFKCGSCTKQYLHQYDLKRHVDLHHKEAPFTCKYCGKPFDRDDHVKDHETSHENGTVKRRRKDDGGKKMDTE